MARLWQSRGDGDIEAGWTAIIRRAPNLPGALCKGSDAWDWERDQPEPPSGRDARLAAAAETCLQCPVLQQCAAYLHRLPMAERPAGVMAGEVTLPPTERRRRARRRTPAPNPHPQPDRPRQRPSAPKEHTREQVPDP